MASITKVGSYKVERLTGKNFRITNTGTTSFYVWKSGDLESTILGVNEVINFTSAAVSQGQLIFRIYTSNGMFSYSSTVLAYYVLEFGGIQPYIAYTKKTSSLYETYNGTNQYSMYENSVFQDNLYSTIDLRTVLTLNGTNVNSFNVGGTDISGLPANATITADTTITAEGKASPILTLQNNQNMKNVQIGDTVYTNFPVTYTMQANTNVQLSGRDDPKITIEYSNTSVPVVTNT